MRSQNFDHCHSFLLAFSATGGARKRPPFHKGAFCHATPAALPPAKPPSGEPDRRRFNRSRQLTGDPRPAAAAALPPPKPLRGQVDCRCFQQKQAADQGLPSPVPRGKVQEGVPPSWFPAQAGKNPNHFSRRHVRREKFFSRSDVSGPPWRARRPSGVPSPSTERRGWLVEMAPPFPRNPSRSEVWTKDRLWAVFGPHPSTVLCHRLSARRAL